MLDLEDIGYLLYMSSKEEEENNSKNDNENAEADGLRNAEATRSLMRTQRRWLWERRSVKTA